ncbi:hypothetical protein FSP39_000439 [Pinctada imbricata]|uniref:EGF-like domain-containing protein n=1 Tax=Pinctada imbricata TaxID=66713 RepID=A0AA88YMH4_PINIB|nr:hypothetical protein FSP39_000439 [Pinctada imbricata]
MSYVALQIVKDLCVTIVGKNTTLNDSSPDIVYAVQTQSCPNDCKQQGACDNGVCDCDEGFSGDDCSVLLSDPPTVLELSQGEYCDVTDEDCSLLKLRGHNFYSLHPRCRIEYEIIEENGDVSNRNLIYKHGEQKSQFEAMCDIQKKLKKYNQQSAWIAYQVDPRCLRSPLLPGPMSFHHCPRQQPRQPMKDTKNPAMGASYHQMCHFMKDQYIDSVMSINNPKRREEISNKTPLQHQQQNTKTPDAKTQKTSTARDGKETHDM